MIRLEIIANNTVEQDIRDELSLVDGKFCFSKIASIHGRGRQSPRRGDDVWPEENFLFFIYCDEEKARNYTAGVKRVKERFPQEGIKVFALPYEEIQL